MNNADSTSNKMPPMERFGHVSLGAIEASLGYLAINLMVEPYDVYTYIQNGVCIAGGYYAARGALRDVRTAIRGVTNQE